MKAFTLILKALIKNSSNWISVWYTIATKYARSIVLYDKSHPKEIGVKSYFPCTENYFNGVDPSTISTITRLKVQNQDFKENKTAVVLNEKFRFHVNWKNF